MAEGHFRVIVCVFGLLQSVITPMSMSIINFNFDSSDSGGATQGGGSSVMMKGTALGVFNYGVYLAFSLSLSLGTWVFDRYGWRANYIIFGLAGLAFSLIAPFLLIPATLSSGAGAGVMMSDYEPVGANVENILAADVGAGVDQQHREVLARAVAASGYGWREYWGNSRRILGAILRFWSRDLPVASLLLVLAAGLRGGAGYIWVTYMAVYYSELFSASDSSCQYSYNADYSGQDSVYSTCGSGHPYCVDGMCSSLFATPWHNRGIAHEALESYMWWVPLVGSAMGCLCGGLLSDHFIERCGADGMSTGTANAEDSKKGLLEGVDADGRHARGVSAWLRWVLCGGTGGRALVAGVGVLLATPFVYLALTNRTTDPPLCFFMLVLSGFFGEAYIGLVLTILLEITPREDYSVSVPAGVGGESIKVPLLVPTVALFGLCVNVIAGNMPLLVPLVIDALTSCEHYSHMFDFAAAPMLTADAAGGDPQEVTFFVEATGALPLQNSLLITLLTLYTVSGTLLIALAFVLAKYKVGVYPSSREQL